MMFIATQTKVYLALGSTDIRKAINDLSVFVEDKLEMDPFTGHLFVFCNRRRNVVMGSSLPLTLSDTSPIF